MGAYGRVVHLQPAQWINGWPLVGALRDENLPGNPVAEGEYPVAAEMGLKINPSDEFDGAKLSLNWQTPANPRAEWCALKNGLRLNCIYYGGKALSDLPQLYMQKVNYLNFSVNAKCRLNLERDGDETGFTVFGREYFYVCVTRMEGRNFLEIRKGRIGGEEDETLARSQPFDENYINFKLSAKYEERHRLSFKFTFGKVAFTHKFYASAGVWTGAKVGVYARSEAESKGFATYKYFRVACTDNRVKG